MELTTMYPGMVGSPTTTLAAAINDTVTTITVVDGNALPPAPNIMALVSGEQVEVILYGAKTGNTLSSVTRGVRGQARSWAVSGTKCARNFTSLDWDAIRENFTKLAADGKEAASLQANLVPGQNVVLSDRATPLQVAASGRTLSNKVPPQTARMLGTVSGLGVAQGWIEYGVTGVTYSVTTDTDGTRRQRIEVTGVANSAMGVMNGTTTVGGIDVMPGEQYLCLAEVQTTRASAGLIARDLTSGTTFAQINTPITSSNATVIAGRITIPSGCNRIALYVADPVTTGRVVGDYLTVTKVAIYQVDTETYAKIGSDPEYTGDKLTAKFPYVDGTQHTQGLALLHPGHNLMGGIPSQVHANAVINGQYDMTLNATAANQWTQQSIGVMAGQSYFFKVTAPSAISRVYINSYNASGTQVGSSIAVTGSDPTIPFTPVSGVVSVTVFFGSSVAGTVTFKNWMLVIGTAADLPPSFVPRQDQLWTLSAKLAGGIVGLPSDQYDSRTRVLTEFWEKDVSLGGSRTWAFTQSHTGFKRVQTSLAAVPGRDASQLVSKYDGKPLMPAASGGYNGPDYARLSGNNLFITIAVADSGWGEDYTPLAAEISAYFFGWKMNNGTFGTPYNGSGTKTWTRWDATNNTGAVTSVPTVLATDYPGYLMSYVRATPKVTEVGTPGISLHPGPNSMEVMAGVIWRKKVTPAPNADGTWMEINSPLRDPVQFLEYGATKILGIYKGMDDETSAWTIRPIGYNLTERGERALIPIADYDPDADYYVTYQVLDRYAYTAIPSTVAIRYEASLGSVVGQLVEDTAKLQTHDVVQDAAIDWVEAHGDNTRFDLDAHTADNVKHITAAERTAWNAKASTAVATISANGLMGSTDKAKLDGIGAGAQANRAIATQAQAEAGIDNGTDMTPLRTAQAVAVKTGDLAALQTTTKSTLVGAVNELFTSVSDGKSRIAAAITDRGGTVAANAPFATLEASIRALPAVQAGALWTVRSTPVNLSWRSVCYGNGLFVAVAVGGTGNGVMTSPDGITWTSRVSAADSGWQSVCYGNGLFVAVAITGTTRVMTSPDGINWTIRSSASNSWYGVCYGNGLFVAVADSGSNRVMTSPDGITWTSRTSASYSWNSVCYGNGLFVAVGSSSRIMTSPDGITWTERTSSVTGSWNSVCYGNGLFVAVGYSKIMTSPDGINWTERTSPNANYWSAVYYGNGLFVATGGTSESTDERIMTSPDGINWIIRSAPTANVWSAVCFGNGAFVSVSQTGTGNRAMSSHQIL